MGLLFHASGLKVVRSVVRSLARNVARNVARNDLRKACFYAASSQRGDSENSEVHSRSLTWLTMASLSVV